MDRETFTRRTEAVREKLLRIARSMLHPDDCEDAVQGAILSAWAHRNQLRDEAAFEAWLTQILVNRCRQIQRGYQREKEMRASVIHRTRETAEDGSVLDEAMEALSEPERQLIDLHHLQGYSLRELSVAMGQSEDVLKMRLYRARKRLKVILVSLLLPVLLASAAVGAGWIDVNWFLINRRAEPAAIGVPVTLERFDMAYSGQMLEVSISDAVWDAETLSLSAVYAIAGKDAETCVVYSGQIGVDGERHDHIWTDEGILPLREWADGRAVHAFSVEGWRLGGQMLAGKEDALADGRGETFYSEWRLDLITPQRYEKLLDAEGMLTLTADLWLEDAFTGEILEKGILTLRTAAPSVEEWRRWHETVFR